MGPGNPRYDGNLPSPFEESSNHHRTDTENQVFDNAHTDSASKYPECIFISDSPEENVYGTAQSLTEDPAISTNESDFMSFGTLQNSQVLGDGLRNQDFCDTGYQNPLVNSNYIPSMCTSGSFDMNAQERVASRNQSQTGVTFGASISNSTNEAVLSNVIDVDAYDPSNNINGGFLALGLGGDAGNNREERFNISPQYNSSYALPARNSNVLPAARNSYVLPAARNSYVLPETHNSNVLLAARNSYVLPETRNSYVPPANTNYSNCIQNSTQVFSGFQQSMLNNPSAWTSQFNGNQSSAVNWGDTSGLLQNPNPYQYPFYSPSHGSPDHYNLNGNFGFAANSPRINPTMAVPADYQGSTGPNSLQSNNFVANYPQHGFAGHHVPFSNVSHPTAPRSGSVTHDYLGLPTQPTQGFSSHLLGGIPPPLGVYSSGPTPTFNLNPAQSIRNISSSGTFGPQIGQHRAINPVKSGPISSRTGGIQFNYPAQFNQETPILKQARPQAQRPRNTILPPLNAPRPPYTGPGPSSLQVRMPPQTSSYVTNKSSLKRRAAKPLYEPSWGRRKKYMHVPPHSTINRSHPPVTSYVEHIKCSANVESTPKLTGWDCVLCKLDLSFEPDNPVHQPIILPVVAVLPCGHSFHDECLQRITPADQAKDPPCIPCAMGEN